MIEHHVDWTKREVYHSGALWSVSYGFNLRLGNRQIHLWRWETSVDEYTRLWRLSDSSIRGAQPLHCGGNPFLEGWNHLTEEEALFLLLLSAEEAVEFLERLYGQVKVPLER